MNGSVGVVSEQWLKNENRDKDPHKEDYYIIQFPNFTITTPWIPGKLITWIPIPEVTN